MPNEKSPGNDGLKKEFYETFWDDIKRPLTLSFQQALKKGELSTSQKQAVIKLIEKKGKNKRMIENWRPISLLNVDLKIFSKAVASRLRACLDTIISSGQCAYVEGRFINMEQLTDSSKTCNTSPNDFSLIDYYHTKNISKSKLK